MNKKSLLALVMLASALVCQVSHAAIATPQKAQSVEGFDFNYSTETDPKFALIQVFDDGDRTYFQFGDIEKYPAVYMESDNGKREMVGLEAKTPYLIVKAVANKFVLVDAKKNSIVVSYNGKRLLNVPTQVAPPVAPIAKQTEPKKPIKKQTAPVEEGGTPSDDAHSKPVQDETRYIQAIKINIPFFENSVTVSKKSREDLEERVTALKDTHRAIVRGRPSAEGDISTAKTRSYAIKSLLLKAGFDESVIELKTETMPKPGKTEGFYLSEILLIEADANTDSPKSAKAAESLKKLNIKSGQKISELVENYGKANGWMVSWEAPETSADIDLTISGNFDEVITRLIDAMNRSGAGLKAIFYDNNQPKPLLRVLEKK